MNLLKKATKLLSTNHFDKKRCLAAHKLYNMAKGEEKEMIGQLFESQYILAKTPEDIMWLNSLD